jgi:hypothetical protein
MHVPVISLPVRCSQCGASTPTDFPVAVVAIALVKWNNMCLYSACHEGTWDASERELDLLRQHVGASWLRTHGRPHGEPHPAHAAFLEREQRLEHEQRDDGWKYSSVSSAGARRSSASQTTPRRIPSRNIN